MTLRFPQAMASLTRVTGSSTNPDKTGLKYGRSTADERSGRPVGVRGPVIAQVKDELVGNGVPLADRIPVTHVS
ncbi:hypothetical protein AB0P12_28355, partial [Streptomyces subrutilus]